METKNNVTVYIFRTFDESKEASRQCTEAALVRHFGCLPAIKREKSGKPVFSDRSGFFSISHSQNIFILAVSEDENIGIDVEVPVEGKDYSRLIARYGQEDFTNDEFLRVWTAKEACCKLTGRGIGGLSDVFVRRNPFEAELVGVGKIYLYDLSLAVGAPCALAASGEITWKANDL